MAGFTVTPWEVSGKVNYGRLVKEFGTEALSPAMAERITKAAGRNHFMLRRGIFFSHRELGQIFRRLDKGEEFYLYTGRGPSGATHLGHLVPYIFTKYLQDAFNVKLYFQLTNDEKFLLKRGLPMEEVNAHTTDNALDFIAVGFKPGKTKIIRNMQDIGHIYEIAVDVAKRVTFSTVKAVFGFRNETNIGMIFFPALQAAPAFLESKLQGKKVSCVIPCAIDQDPYWRIARDVAEKLGYYKPGAIHGRFLPGLKEGGKMSASDPDSAIFTTDGEKTVKGKVGRAFTGGQPTVEEQKAKGGKPEICNVYQYYYFLFEEDDRKLEARFDSCKKGEIMCGECKKDLAERINKFLSLHRKRKEAAKKNLGRYWLK